MTHGSDTASLDQTWVQIRSSIRGTYQGQTAFIFTQAACSDGTWGKGLEQTLQKQLDQKSKCSLNCISEPHLSPSHILW